MVPVIWWGRSWVNNHQQSEILAEYLYSGPWLTGSLLVPKRLNRKKLNAGRQELYESFLRLEQPVPKEYLPGKWYEDGLLEYRLAYRRAVKNVEKEKEESRLGSQGLFKPEIVVTEQRSGRR